jgi:hypothetical protein
MVDSWQIWWAEVSRLKKGRMVEGKAEKEARVDL